MHRIDSSTATPDNRFTEGDPTIPVPATTVTDDWLNAVQEEAVAIILAAGMALDKNNNAQVLAAIQKLIADKTGIAKVGVNGLVNPDGVTIRIDGTGKISAIAQSMDPIGGIRFFEDEMPRPGYVECNAGVVSNFSVKYPEMAAYLETPWGQSRLVSSLAEYEALHTAIWHTNADGTTVGWQGIGGVAKFWWDKVADTLKMPDLQDMFQGAAGPSLGVGEGRGDIIRDIIGSFSLLDHMIIGPTTTGAFSVSGAAGGAPSGSAGSGYAQLLMAASDVVPTGPTNAPRRWGALACAYLGQPAS